MHLITVLHHITAILARKVVLPAAVARVPSLSFLPLTSGTGEVALIVVEVEVPLQTFVVEEGDLRAAMVAVEATETISSLVLLTDVLLQKVTDVMLEKKEKREVVLGFR